MPSSSSFLTRVGSVYLAGGFVSWPSQLYSLTSIFSPTLIAGNLRSPSSLSTFSSTISSYAARKPAKLITDPFARNIASAPVLVLTSKSTLICCFLASAIWDAIVRFQIKS